MKRTPWFSAVKDKPVRIGLYETRCFYYGGIHLRFWDGEEWPLDRTVAPRSFGAICDKWRGLTSRASSRSA